MITAHMLYTKKGDDGKTQIFGCDQRLSKSSAVAEALGALDEANSYIGIIKCKVKNIKIKKIINNIQENIFIIQAEVAGANKKITEDKILVLEEIINDIEKKLPPIKTFFIAGVTEGSAQLDFARTLVRRAERRVVAMSEEKKVKIHHNTLGYLNRLSSLLYALARQSAHKSGIKESAPSYK